MGPIDLDMSYMGGGIHLNSTIEKGESETIEKKQRKTI